MSRRIRCLVAIAALVFAALAGTQFVGPGQASADFVCPVLPVSEQAFGHSNAEFIPISQGDVSILPGKAGDPASPVVVPDHATNDEGAGSPAGAHAAPGQPGYTAIWNTP